MKIPETSANVGAYYGNEENGQWQPNGVIIDSGVGGGVVGSGDAGVHRPPVYPVHIPRGHIQGYVMAGAYYPPAYPPGPAPGPPQDDFADYMWMENEEEFDKQVMQQLEEEALMEQCIEAMLEDEQRERRRPHPHPNGHNHLPTTSNGAPSISLEEAVSRSTLNPLAAEFVPTRKVSSHTTEEKHESPPEAPTLETQKVTEDEPSTTETTQPTEDSKTEDPPSSHTDPPEVSAADIQPIDKRPKETKKVDTKKVDTKKTKPVAVKSDTKVQVKKKDIKAVKSETKLEKEDETADIVKTQPLPSEEPSGPKPINYAAAAKANKPKKPTTPPACDKNIPPSLKIVEKSDKKPKPEKIAIKTEKPIQRKNSAK